MAKTFFLYFACLTMAASPLMADKPAEALFQDAMVKETGERDPEAALKLYQQVVEQAGHNPRLLAKARLHMGACLERLGKRQEAENIYLQIVQDSAASLTEAAQAAQANLEKLEAEDKKVREEAAKEAARPKAMVLVKEFHDTRFSFLAGPEWSRSGNRSTKTIDLALRCRISPDNRPLALFGEVGGFVPVGGSKIQDAIQRFDAVTTDSVSLKLKYQAYLALVAELPHGAQRKVIPEMGIGAALTSSETSGSGTANAKEISPRLSAGLHILPDHVVSGILEGSYIANPYAKSVQIASPAHSQTFSFPNSMWGLSAKIQIKIGWPKSVLKEKL